MTDYAEMRAFAESLAEAARAVSLPYFRSDVEVDAKADASPVTRADRETEARVRGLVARRFPDAGLYGEEDGTLRLEAEYVWAVDPIDGTKAFVTGSPLFGTLIGLVHRGRPAIGVVDMPALEETWVGVAGEQTRYRWRKSARGARTRRCTALPDAVVSTTSIDMFRPEDHAAFERASRQARFRCFGGDCYQYGRLASGDLDLVIEAGLKPYDYMALIPVVEGAGGVITDWAGEPLGFQSDGRVVAAATPDLHSAALAALRS